MARGIEPTTTRRARRACASVAAACALLGCTRSEPQAPPGTVEAGFTAAAEPGAARQERPGEPGEPGDVVASRLALPEAKLALLETKLALLEAQLASERARADALETANAALRADLAALEERRVVREREWLEYTSLLGRIPAERLPGGKPFPVELPEAAVVAAAAEEQPPAELPDPRLEARAKEIAKALRTLFTLEEVRGLDLLECGRLSGPPGAAPDCIGPVVFRLLDGTGRLSGSLFAERMRLEGSRSARTLSLVLEDGYEMRGGARLPFDQPAAEGRAGATRRIVIDGVDPRPWADEFRELFGERGLELSGDDGLWDLAVVQQGFNDVLKAERVGGTYRLRELGGVQDGVLLAVHLERADAEGRVERRLFADRLKLSRSGSGVELLLENGVQVRGEDERVPFLDGRYRILLPAADVEAWTRAGLPGLAPPPAARPRED